MATVSPRQAVLTRFTVRHPHPRHLLITIGTLVDPGNNRVSLRGRCHLDRD
jgi:hypothetical protein